jgi:hypothetical protein
MNTSSIFHKDCFHLVLQDIVARNWDLFFLSKIIMLFNLNFSGFFADLSFIF